MARSRHPDKHIEEAVRAAEQRGWRVERSGGHAWGRLHCPAGVRGGCIVSVYSTPRNPVAHARLIRKAVQRCDHGADGRIGGPPASRP
ncbi:MAG: hypothetical protein O2946_13805 [Planctomycetota bacterium]|nr:hypothetical protein [Planctomycetota bacterium]MDA0970873.1 hypothetical protein [Planctomycetota bacterium]